jgi:hypothetical protein
VRQRALVPACTPVLSLLVSQVAATQSTLGLPVQANIDNACCRVEKELRPGEDQPLLQPMAVAPLRHSLGAGIPSSVLPPRLLVVDIMSASSAAKDATEGGSLAETDRQLLISVQLLVDGQPHASGASCSALCCAASLHPFSAAPAWNVARHSWFGCPQMVGRCGREQSASLTRSLWHGMSAWCWKLLSCRVRVRASEGHQCHLLGCCA